MVDCSSLPVYLQQLGFNVLYREVRRAYDLIIDEFGLSKED